MNARLLASQDDNATLTGERNNHNDEVASLKKSLKKARRVARETRSDLSAFVFKLKKSEEARAALRAVNASLRLRLIDSAKAEYAVDTKLNNLVAGLRDDKYRLGKEKIELEKKVREGEKKQEGLGKALKQSDDMLFTTQANRIQPRDAACKWETSRHATSSGSMTLHPTPDNGFATRTAAPGNVPVDPGSDEQGISESSARTGLGISSSSTSHTKKFAQR
jgi:DNA repair exonuclease SbcCD ATPase subunit